MRRNPLAVSILLIFSATAALEAQVKEAPLPRLVKKDGRFALFVDDAPFLMLGAQINNSSAWPGMLPKVWPAIQYLHANTVEMPVYWEQLEGAVQLLGGRRASQPGARASRPAGSALVWHVEERQPALHAGMDEAGTGTILPRDR
jgi:hypothetical protein